VTLVELMVAIALATMLIGTASFIFIELKNWSRFLVLYHAGSTPSGYTCVFQILETL